MQLDQEICGTWVKFHPIEHFDPHQEHVVSAKKSDISLLNLCDSLIVFYHGVEHISDITLIHHQGGDIEHVPKLSKVIEDSESVKLIKLPEKEFKNEWSNNEHEATLVDEKLSLIFWFSLNDLSGVIVENFHLIDIIVFKRRCQENHADQVNAIWDELVLDDLGQIFLPDQFDEDLDAILIVNLISSLWIKKG